jgi:hypothetical protein
MSERHELNQQLEHWQQIQAETEAYLAYTKAQIHRVRVSIGELTIEQMRSNGELTN